MIYYNLLEHIISTLLQAGKPNISVPAKEQLYSLNWKSILLLDRNRVIIDNLPYNSGMHGQTSQSLGSFNKDTTNRHFHINERSKNLLCRKCCFSTHFNLRFSSRDIACPWWHNIPSSIRRNSVVGIVVAWQVCSYINRIAAWLSALTTALTKELK